MLFIWVSKELFYKTEPSKPLLIVNTASTNYYLILMEFILGHMLKKVGFSKIYSRYRYFQKCLALVFLYFKFHLISLKLQFYTLYIVTWWNKSSVRNWQSQLFCHWLLRYIRNYEKICFKKLLIKLFSVGYVNVRTWKY